MQNLAKFFIIFFLLQQTLAQTTTNISTNCIEYELEDKLSISHLVFSGIVRSLERNYSHNTYAANIEIRQIIKGSIQAADLVKSEKLNPNTRIVLVRNFGAPAICNSKVRPHDTKIFFVIRNDLNKLYLNSSVVNIEKSDNKNYDLVSCSVDSKLCSFGAECKLNSSTKAVSCKCELKCDMASSRPICGSDRVTYKNLCHLEQTRCLQQRDIKIQSEKSCYEYENEQCKLMDCPYYSVCTIDSKSLAPKCVCPTLSECMQTSSNMVNLKAVVNETSFCGTDGVTYPSLCHLEVAACNRKQDIRAYTRGKCKPCDDFLCSVHEQCKVGENREALCACNNNCTMEYKPVCANNAKTYLNECFLRLEMCIFDVDLFVLYDKECTFVDENSNLCSQSICNNSLGSYCMADENGIAQCKCADKCADILEFICGSDGVTYKNPCEMQRASCLLQRDIHAIHAGKCGVENLCKEKKCNFGAECSLKNGLTPFCECNFMSSEEYRPVCGSNNKTYSNLWKVKEESCKEQTPIDIQYEGICDLCKITSCPHYGTCISDGLHAKCVCQDACADINMPVCGSDGQTYNSVCHLQLAACKSQSSITVLSSGPCEPCMENSCEDLEIDYMCGSDGRTYTNLCYLDMAACITKTNITMLHTGVCTAQDSQRSLVCKESLECPDKFICVRSLCVAPNSCVNSTYGCCSDGLSAAQGPDMEGCPIDCDCHPAGSYNQYCDKHTGQCSCRPGVVGKLCDSCGIGYWGIKKILRTNNIGCIPCSCNKIGSIREDCSQEDGRCECKKGVSGLKCTDCPPNHDLTINGCVPRHIEANRVQRLCSTIKCNYTGAYCKLVNNEPKCICDEIKCDEEVNEVCGEDGRTYSSLCELEKYACKKQTTIALAYKGHCNRIDSVEEKIFDFNKTRPQYIQSNSINDLVVGSYRPYGTQKCVRDYDCGINMECLANVCYCIDGFIPENDHCKNPKTTTKKIILGVNLKRYTFDACKSRPCASGSFCESLSNAKYYCHCPMGKYGKHCQFDISYIPIPYFKKNSFLELQSFDRTEEGFNIEIEFKSERLSGLLFYSSQYADGTGDSLAIFIKDGYLELKLESGDGVTNIIMTKSISLGKYHKVYAQKRIKAILFQMDDFIPIKVFKYNTKIFLTNNIILGSLTNIAKIPHRIRSRIPIQESIYGCVQYLKINTKVFNISFPSIDIINGLDISACQDKHCQNEDCSYNGRCRLTNDFKNQVRAECMCEKGYAGKYCEVRINPCATRPCIGNYSYCVPTAAHGFECVCQDDMSENSCDAIYATKTPFVANLSGKSYIERPKIDADFKTIEIIFLPKHLNGILLYNGDYNGKQFIGIKLQNSHIHFSYQIDDYFEEISSRNPLSTQQWHHLRIIREAKRFKMFVNGENFVSTLERPSLIKFNLDDSLFIGGIRDASKVNRKFKVARGFKGSLQKASVDDKYVKEIRSGALELAGIKKYEGFPCTPDKCKNQGVCIPNGNKFKCICTDEFRGDLCQKKKGRGTRDELYLDETNSTSALYLDGHTELLYLNRITETILSQGKNKFAFKIRTKAANGLLLYTGNPNEDNYLALGIANGRVILQFITKRQKTVFSLRTNEKINDNNWHLLEIERAKRRTTISIDNQIRVNGTYDESNTNGFYNLVTDGYLRVGGFRNLPIGLPSPFRQGFQGCLASFKVDGRSIDLISHNKNQELSPVYCSNN